MRLPFNGNIPIYAPFGYSAIYGSTFHEGIDYDMPVGTQLVAAGSGKVIYAGFQVGSGAGNAVTIQVGQYLAKCFHMSQVDVSVGQTVTEGQDIGLSGNTGNSTGPHVHFQVEQLQGGKWTPINPLTVLTQGVDDMFEGKSAEEWAIEAKDGNKWKAKAQPISFTDLWVKAGGTKGNPDVNSDNFTAIINDDAKYADWVKATPAWQGSGADLSKLDVVPKGGSSSATELKPGTYIVK